MATTNPRLRCGWKREDEENEGARIPRESALYWWYALPYRPIWSGSRLRFYSSLSSQVAPVSSHSFLIPYIDWPKTKELAYRFRAQIYLTHHIWIIVSAARNDSWILYSSANMMMLWYIYIYIYILHNWYKLSTIQISAASNWNFQPLFM